MSTNTNKFAGVIVINLERRKDRLTKFVNNFRTSDISKCPLYRLQAIDSSVYMSDEALRQTMTQRALDDWKDLQEGSKSRKNGEQIPSLGALACYKSHMNAWRFIMRQGKVTGQLQTPYLVCEDDMILPRKFLSPSMAAYVDAKSKFNDLPLVCKFHALFTSHPIETVGKNLLKPSGYWGMTVYALSPYDAMHLLNLDWLPIDIQIDAREREFRDQGKLHVVVCPLATLGGMTSDVQIIENA